MSRERSRKSYVGEAPSGTGLWPGRSHRHPVGLSETLARHGRYTASLFRMHRLDMLGQQNEPALADEWLSPGASFFIPTREDCVAATESLLLVMPDARRRARCGSAFDQAGFHVLHAPTAGIALTRCEREHPSVVLTDVLVPGMHGVDIARALRACAPRTRIPLIVGLLAPLFDDTDDAAAGLLFDHLIREPVTLDLLVRDVCDARQRHNAGPWRWRVPGGPVQMH